MYKRHQIHLEKESPCKDWYIQVVAPDGCYAYDGWWRDSADKTEHEASAEAKRGARI